MQNIYTPAFKFSTSKGRDTYGYRICTISDEHGKGRACGGGYDLFGTALGEWMENAFTAELLELAKHSAGGTWDSATNKRESFCDRWDPNNNKPDTNYKENALPGLTLYTRNGKPEAFSLDGGVGRRAMEEILQRFGFVMREPEANFNKRGGRKDTGVLIITRKEA